MRKIKLFNNSVALLFHTQLLFFYFHQNYNPQCLPAEYKVILLIACGADYVTSA